MNGEQRFLALFGILIDYDRVKLRAGISFDAYSFDGGNTWLLYHDGQFLGEDDFMLGMNICSFLGCAVINSTAGLS